MSSPSRPFTSGHFRWAWVAAARVGARHVCGLPCGYSVRISHRVNSLLLPTTRRDSHIPPTPPTSPSVSHLRCHHLPSVLLCLSDYLSTPAPPVSHVLSVGTYLICDSSPIISRILNTCLLLRSLLTPMSICMFTYLRYQPISE